MPLSKPVRLDPYQRIVNVGWGGVDILVLEFSYERSGPRPGLGSSAREQPFETRTQFNHQRGTTIDVALRQLD